MHLIKAETDPLKRDFGILTSLQLGGIIELLKQFLTQLHALLQSIPESGCAEHATCASCGLSVGFELGESLAPTVYGVLWAIYYEKLFVCHGGQPAWKDGHQVDVDNLRMCGNFSKIRDHRLHEAFSLAHRFLLEIHKIAPPLPRPTA
jgi:hypothetical protein